MVEKRLLVKDTREGQVVVEVARESLLRQWRELAAWLHDEAQALKDADSLERAAADWQASGRDESWLLEGTRLTEAETLAAIPGFADRLQRTRDYLAAARTRENHRLAAEEQHRQAELKPAKKLAAAETAEKQGAQNHAVALRKRSRILIAVLAVTTVIAAIAAFFYYVRADNAEKQATARLREATALRLVAEAQSMLVRPGGDVRALQQLVAADALAPEDAQGALLGAVMARRPMLKITLIDKTGQIAATKPVFAALSPDGQRIVTVSSDDYTLRVWDAGTGAPVGAPPPGDTGRVLRVAFSPDGTRIVSDNSDDTLRLWDAGTGAPNGAPLIGHTDSVFSLAFSPDGRRIVSGSRDDTVRIWDVATGQPIGNPLTGHTGPVNSVAFSPDGRRIVSGGRQDGADMGRRHRPAHRQPAHWSHRCGE